MAGSVDCNLAARRPTSPSTTTYRFTPLPQLLCVIVYFLLSIRIIIMMKMILLLLLIIISTAYCSLDVGVWVCVGGGLIQKDRQTEREREREVAW